MALLYHLLSQEYITDAQELALLQEKIFEITPDTVKDAIDWISNSKFATDPVTFLSTIVKATMIRPKDIDLHTILVLGYSSQTNSAEKIKELLLHKFILNSERLILFLAREGFISPLEISNTVASFPDPDIALFAFFSPELSAFNPEMIDKFYSLFDDKNLMSFEVKFKRFYSRYQKNNWELLNERRFNVYEPNSIEEIIMSDDLDRFIPYIKSDHFDPYYTVQYTPYTPTIYPFDNPTIAQFAAFCGSANIFMTLVKLPEIDISVRNEHDVSLANFAVAGGNEEIINYLVDKRKSDFYNEALQSAAKFHRNSLFKKIYENLPNPEYKLRFGTALDTVFNCCVSEENVDLILFCLSNDFDINRIGMYDTTAVHIALSSCSPLVLSIILNISTIQLNVKAKGIDPPFFTAVQMQNTGIIQQFIDLSRGENSKVNICVKDEFGRTAIFFAAENDDYEIVKMLFETGKYDINYRDKFGQTIAHLAAMNNSIKVVKFLLQEAYPDLGIMDICGRTPVQIALKNNYNEIANMMSDYSMRNESSDPDTDDEEEEENEEDLGDEEEEEEEEEDDDEEEDEEEEEEEEEEEKEKKKKKGKKDLESSRAKTEPQLDREMLGDLLEFRDKLAESRSRSSEEVNKGEDEADANKKEEKEGINDNNSNTQQTETNQTNNQNNNSNTQQSENDPADNQNNNSNAQKSETDSANNQNNDSNTQQSENDPADNQNNNSNAQKSETDKLNDQASGIQQNVTSQVNNQNNEPSAQQSEIDTPKVQTDASNAQQTDANQENEPSTQQSGNA